VSLRAELAASLYGNRVEHRSSHGACPRLLVNTNADPAQKQAHMQFRTHAPPALLKLSGDDMGPAFAGREEEQEVVP
jgi:hypothetical protein